MAQYYRGHPASPGRGHDLRHSARGVGRDDARRSGHGAARSTASRSSSSRARLAFETYSFVRPFYIPLVFNLRHPILKNVEVRRACRGNRSRGDRRGVPCADTAGRRRSGLAVPLGVHAGACISHAFNPAPHAARLDAAGFPIRRAAPRTRCRAVSDPLFVLGTDPQFERIALLLQRQLADVGVDLVLGARRAEASSRHRIRTGDFDTYLLPACRAAGRSTGPIGSGTRDSNGAARIHNPAIPASNEVLDRLRQPYPPMLTVRVGCRRPASAILRGCARRFLAWIETTRAVESGSMSATRRIRTCSPTCGGGSAAAPQQKAASR